LLGARTYGRLRRIHHLLLAASILAAVHHAETVGVATALLVLLLPAIAAVRAAQHNLIETSLHLLSVRR